MLPNAEFQIRVIGINVPSETGHFFRQKSNPPTNQTGENLASPEFDNFVLREQKYLESDSFMYTISCYDLKIGTIFSIFQRFD